MDAPPQQNYGQVPPPPTAKGCGCCAAGCGTMLVIAIAGLMLVLGATWYVYSKAVDRLTAAQPITVQLEEPSAEQFTAARAKVDQLRNAAATGQAMTAEFTAPELNALIARDPHFSDLRGKMRVGIKDSIMTLDLSVPLSGVPMPRVKRRWFNGSASFGFSYDENGFSFSPRALDANGYTIAEELFGDLAPTIDNYFNTEYGKDSGAETEEERFWRQVQSMAVDGDRVIITTRGGAPQ